MVWGTSRGVDDLVTKLEQNQTGDSLWVSSMRKFNDVDKFCAALAGNSSLKELLCSGHELNPEQARAFCQALNVNKTLETLSLGSSTLGDSGLEALLENWKNETLCKLDLEYKGLTSLSGTCLGAFLGPTSASNLKEIRLSRNALGPSGISDLAKGLAGNTTLRVLDLSDNELTSEGMTDLIQSLSKCKLQELYLSRNPGMGPAAMASFAQCVATGEASEWLESLSLLWLDACGIEDSGMSHLSSVLPKLVNLEDVHFGENKLTDEGLNSLWSGETKYFRRIFPALLHCRLPQNELKAPFSLISSLQPDPATSGLTLKTLDLTSNQIRGSDALDPPKDVTDPVDDTQVQVLAEDDSTKDPETLMQLMRDIAGIRTVANLQLLGNPLGDRLVSEFVNALVQDENHPLETLSIGGAGLSDSGLASVFEALHNHKGLSTLEVGGNTFGDLAEEALNVLHEKNPSLDVARDKKTDAKPESVG